MLHFLNFTIAQFMLHFLILKAFQFLSLILNFNKRGVLYKLSLFLQNSHKASGFRKSEVWNCAHTQQTGGRENPSLHLLAGGLFSSCLTEAGLAVANSAMRCKSPFRLSTYFHSWLHKQWVNCRCFLVANLLTDIWDISTLYPSICLLTLCDQNTQEVKKNAI